MEPRRKHWFSPDQSAEVFPEGDHKLWTPVRGHLLGKAVEQEDIEQGFCGFLVRWEFRQRDKVGELGKSVDDGDAYYFSLSAPSEINFYEPPWRLHKDNVETEWRKVRIFL